MRVIKRSRILALLLVAASLFLTPQRSLPAADQPAQQSLPAIGEWDGATEKAKLDRPYEDPKQAYIPFGIISYFLSPWRAYMDTQPASQFLGSMAFNINNSPENQDAVMQIMEDAGIRKVRYECGWGNLDWNNQLTGPPRTNVLTFLRLAKKHRMRPLLLLNAHHAVPCPIRGVTVQLLQDAKKGDRSFKIAPADVSKIRLGYTGPMDTAQYCSALPIITAAQADGTCALSCPLGQDLKAGNLDLHELKFLPLHGSKLQGADAQTEADSNAATQATLDGWKQYIGQICDVALEGLGTKGQPDAGFDVEAWNEQTFGSNFLDINNYYDPKRVYAEPLSYSITRPVGPGMRPDAKTQFKAEGPQVLVSLAVDYVRSRPELAAVNVDDGIGNQWPWNTGADAWPGQDAYSRHFYTGGWQDVSPSHPIGNPNNDTINALAQRDGTPPPHPNDWQIIIPGSNFIPTLRIGLPEFMHTGFKTESLARDVLPDVRWGGDSEFKHGRFTHNGDFHLMHLWETEVNFARGAFFDDFFKQTKISQDDPRAYKIDSDLTAKLLLRQYVFHNQKGLRNLYIFASDGGAYQFGFFEPPFFKALAASKGQLTDAVKKEIPSYFQGLGWLTKQMEAADPIVATRALRVDELWEYKPRLMYAGDGTPKHPNEWNRDWFAFLPYQLTANKFLIPYYVMTVDVQRAQQPKKDILDPERYHMLDQDFDVTIGNCAGTGAKVSVYDPITNLSVPVDIVPDKTSDSRLTVRLKTVDYPRFLVVEEAQPGPLIQHPQVTVNGDGMLRLVWNTNIPVDHATISFGKDWPNRGANERMVMVQGSNQYSVYVPTGAKGVLAARISVTAGPLTCTWPRWDEDVQGQVVVPGSTASDVQHLDFNYPIDESPQKTASAVPLAPSSSVSLPVDKPNEAFGYELHLPRVLAFTGPDDDQDAPLDQTASPVHLRVRYLKGANHAPLDTSLPFVAVGDQLTKTLVKLPSGKVATLVDMTFMPALHPEMQDFVQRQLLIPTGRDDGDLLILAARGTPDAMKADDAVISSIFASCQPLQAAR